MEVLYVIFALLLGMIFGIIVRHYLDSQTIREINELYQKDRNDLIQTMKQREKLHINTINDLQKRIAEARTIKTVDSEPGELSLEDAVKAVQKVRAVPSSNNERDIWLDMLNDTNIGVPDEPDFGGF